MLPHPTMNPYWWNFKCPRAEFSNWLAPKTLVLRLTTNNTSTKLSSFFKIICCSAYLQWFNVFINWLLLYTIFSYSTNYLRVEQNAIYRILIKYFLSSILRFYHFSYNGNFQFTVHTMRINLHGSFFTLSLHAL